MGCVSSSKERDFGHGIKRASDVSPTQPVSPPATAHPPASRDAQPNPNTSPMIEPMIEPRTQPSTEPSKCSWDVEAGLLPTLTTTATDSKPRRAVPTMGCSSTNASGHIDCLDSDPNTKPSKRPHPREPRFGQSTPNTEHSPMMLRHRTHSCLTSAPASSECPLFSRTLSADALELDAWAPCLTREIPEKTISFDISDSSASSLTTTGTTINSDAYFLKMGMSSVIGTRTLEYLGLVLDHHAVVREVLNATQAKTSGVQPGWSLRWIEVAGACGGSSFHKSRLTSIPVSSRRNVLDILKECKKNRQFCMKVVFACTPAKEPETEDNSMLCHGVGVPFSPDPYRQSFDSDYTSDDSGGASALQAVPLVTDSAAGSAAWFGGTSTINAFTRTRSAPEKDWWLG